MTRPKNNQVPQNIYQTDDTCALQPQPQSQNSHKPQQPTSSITRKIGGTTYHVSIFFSQTSKETFNDKIVRLIKNEALTA